MASAVKGSGAEAAVPASRGTRDAEATKKAEAVLGAMLKANKDAETEANGPAARCPPSPGTPTRA